jgi:hypothetical protein
MSLSWINYWLLYHTLRRANIECSRNTVEKLFQRILAIVGKEKLLYHRKYFA